MSLVPGCPHRRQATAALCPGTFAQRDAQQVPKLMLARRRFAREGRWDCSWVFRASSGPGGSCWGAGVGAGRSSTLLVRAAQFGARSVGFPWVKWVGFLSLETFPGAYLACPNTSGDFTGWTSRKAGASIQVKFLSIAVPIRLFPLSQVRFKSSDETGLQNPLYEHPN